MQVRLPINFTKLKTALTFNSNHMKNHLLIFAVAVLSCFAISCKKDNGTTGGGLDLTGIWVPVNDSMVTDTFWEFDKGHFSIMQAEKPFVFASGKLWHCSKDDFKPVFESNYRIEKSQLYTGDVNRGVATLNEEGSITIGHQEFTLISKMTDEWYATIDCTLQPIDSESETYFVSGHITPSIPGQPITVNCELKTEVTGTSDGFKITFSELPPILEDTSYPVEILCPVAAPLVTSLDRTVSAKLEFENTVYDISYKDTTLVINYTFTSRLEGDVVEADVETGAAWSSCTVENDALIFHAVDNNVGEDRYSNVKVTTSKSSISQTLTIYQSYSELSVVFSTPAVDTDYKETKASVDFNVVNPRKEMKFSARSDQKWIKNIEVKDGKLSFDIEKNISAARNALVYLAVSDKDGNVISKDFSFGVNQSGYLVPVLTVDPETAELDSKAQDLRINCKIDNPEEDGVLDVTVSEAFMHIKEKTADHVIVSFDLNDNTAAREGTVSFSYTYHKTEAAASFTAIKNVSVKQAGVTAPVIKTEESTIVTDYTAKEYEIPFTIENPVEGASLVMEAETVPWMTVVGITDKAVKLRFTEHSEFGVQRHVYAILKYVNKSKVTLASLDLNIYQTMDPPQITVEEGRTFNIGWQAEDITIHYSATNERTGERFVIEPSASWLSVKSQSGNSAVIHAEGRTLGETQSRTGRFNIRYRVGDDDTHNFATLIETVVQEGAPAAPVVTIDEVPVTNYTKKKISLHIHVANDDPQHKGTVEITSVPDWFADDGTPAVWDAVSETYVKTIEVAENPNVSGKVRTAGFVAKFRIPGIESEYLATGSISQTGDPVTITPKKYLMNDDVMGNYVLYDHLDHSDVKIEFTITNPRTGAYVDLYKGNPIGDSWIRGVSYGRDNVTFSLTKNTDDYKFRMSACTFAYTLDLNRLATYSLAIVQYNRYNGYDYIDLGLPSGKKWAPSCISLQSLNYVNQPDFAYGTPDKLYQPLSFQWASADGYYENYKYSTQVNGETVMTKYCNIPGHPYYDGLTKMLPSDDPAVRYLGGEWHTPSHADLNELFLYCTVSYESYSTMHYMKVVGPNGAVLMLRVDPLQYVSMDHSQMLRFMTSDGPIYEDCSKVYAVLYTYGAFDPNKEMEIWMHQVSNRSDAFVVLPVIDR